MNNEPEIDPSKVIRGLNARCAQLEDKLTFWRLSTLGMIAVSIVITAMKCQH